MNKFTNAIKETTSQKLTENGAFAYNTTESDLLDLFAEIGALRPRTEAEITEKFERAFKEDATLAMRMAFYARDVRFGGLGERRTFRIILKWICENYPELATANIPNITTFGRFDDLYTYVGTEAEEAMWKYMYTTLTNDYERMLEGKPISLLAKWLKSINTSSRESRKLARLTLKNLGFHNERHYRKVLARMRDYLNVVENRMSAQEWDKINYSQVPAYAIKNYGSAFAKHDYERWNQYLKDLQKGTTKVNASTLYPYDLVHQYMDKYYGDSYGPNTLTEAQWKALPDYVGDGANVMVMADVSGSMMGRPMETSIGLAAYFAQRNHGPFAGLFLTFTDIPRYIHVRSDDKLYTMINKIRQNVGYNTNLDKAFNLILDTALNNHVPQEDLPRALVVVSDMEIDSYVRYHGLDFVKTWRERFKAYGYELPQLVLWNVEARNDTFLTKMATKGVTFLSGQSASTFRSLIDTLNCKSAYEAMVKVLMNPAYDVVVTKVA
jgi:Domain of unknown function (DUF2828).